MHASRQKCAGSDAREEELTLRIAAKETELRADKLELEEIQVARRVLSRLAGSEDRAEPSRGLPCR